MNKSKTNLCRIPIITNTDDVCDQDDQCPEISELANDQIPDDEMSRCLLKNSLLL